MSKTYVPTVRIRKTGDKVTLVTQVGTAPPKFEDTVVLYSNSYDSFIVGPKKVKFTQNRNLSNCGNFWVFDSKEAFYNARERSAIEQILMYTFAYPDPSISLEQLKKIADILGY